MTYWECLFDKDDIICLSKDCYGTALFDVHYSMHCPTFVSINPLHTSRKDDNVTCFRNILLEFDSIAPHEQLEIIADIPHSTLVWSGGKSYHCIISLEDPVSSRQQYDRLVRAIYEKVPQADKSAKNPSRFTRAPGAIRDNGEEQKLVHVKGRVRNSVIHEWLGRDWNHRVTEDFQPRQRLPRQLSLETYKFLSNGCYGNGTGRNNMLFAAACDMARASYPLTEAMTLLLHCTDLREFEAVRTINSAYKTVNK